ncbi:hypothetical protein CCR75_009600 [Bremia lactucae]|uniref:BHLH domain-containing protein n=1 Tax=Bremia lactucae TaxID=4779 RepID=A0A976IKH7_BRELC|nr:hypothetical protein CCR75_009600 [Bremia lactucae]
MRPCDPRVCSTIGSPCSEPLLTLDDDRGLRKKSREKMRRHEVNVKFEELADLLGLSNRFRKSAVLQEAVSIIKNLKRERNELRRDRDCLQQEVSKLVTCLQYSHLGPVATASLTQPNQQLSRMKLSNHHHRRQAVANSTGTQPVHTHPFHESCDPGINCFPLSSAFCNVSCQQTSNLSSGSSHVVIAPKGLKPNVINSIKPDTEIE